MPQKRQELRPPDYFCPDCKEPLYEEKAPGFATGTFKFHANGEFLCPEPPQTTTSEQ